MKAKYIIPSLIALALTACDAKDEPDYTPATTPVGVGSVHFSAAELTQYVSEDAVSFEVYLYRSEKAVSEALTVQLLVTDESGLFRFPDEASFGAGETIATITVGYDIDDLVANQPYITYIAIDDADTDIYGETTLELTIIYEIYSKWAPFGYVEGTAKDGLGIWSEDGDLIADGVRVLERHVPDNPDVAEYEVQVYMASGTPNPDDPADDEDWLSAIKFSTTDGGETLVVPIQASVVESGYYIADAHYVLPSYFPEAGSYYDEETGTFELELVYIDEDGGAYGPYYDSIKLNGFEDTTDYGLAINDLGQTTVNGTEYALLGFTFNTDEVSKVIYTVVENTDGSALTAYEVASIVDMMLDSTQTYLEVETLTKPGNVALSFSESGYYSAVAAALNAEGEVKATTETTFEYTTSAASKSSASRTRLSAARFSTAELPNIIGRQHLRKRIR